MVNPPMHDLNAAIQQAATGGGGRVSIGPAPTFGQRTAPILMPALLTQMPAESLNFSSVDVTVSGSAALVAAGAAKPAAATVAITPRTIGKIAAVATFNSENYWQSPDVVGVVIATLYANCLSEADKVANAALATAAAAPVPQASWLAAIAQGQAAVAAAGGAPQLVVVPAAVWPVLALELAASTGLVTPSADAIASVLGSRIVLSPEGAGAFVLDPSAAVQVTRDVGFLIDTASGATSNKITAVVDVVSSVFVSVPTQVIEIAKTP